MAGSSCGPGLSLLLLTEATNASTAEQSSAASLGAVRSAGSMCVGAVSLEGPLCDLQVLGRKFRYVHNSQFVPTSCWG